MGWLTAASGFERGSPRFRQHLCAAPRVEAVLANDIFAANDTDLESWRVLSLDQEAERAVA
jgi:hypothetical protein